MLLRFSVSKTLTRIRSELHFIELEIKGFKGKMIKHQRPISLAGDAEPIEPKECSLKPFLRPYKLPPYIQSGR